MDVVYVTVGTTKFDSLIKEITSDAVLSALKGRGCKKLILQLGNGQLPVSTDSIKKKFDIDVVHYGFKFEPVRTDILNSNLTIGHGGAGTCMDILHLQKPGLLVTNEELMGNHQLELTEQMSEENYIDYCTINELAERLKNFNFGKLRRYEHSENMPKLVNTLNKLMS